MFKRQIKEIIFKIENYFKRINHNIESNDDSKIKTVKNLFIDLKNNLIFSNMILVFGTVTLAFIAIFVFTRQSLYNDAIINMKSLIYKNSIEPIDLVVPQPVDNESASKVNQDDENVNEEENNGYIFITYSTWNNNITHNDTNYKIKDEELLLAFDKLIGGQLQGTTEWKGIKYRYLINKNTFPAGTYKIAFYNLTTENRFLKYLLIALISIDLVLSIISYFISVFITNRSINPIKEAMERQKQFTEDASHELRTPLTVMQTNLEVLKSDTNLTIKEQEKWIGYLDDEVKRMSHLVSDLLDLSRLDNNRFNEEYVELNMTEELFKTAEAYSKFIKARGLELRTNIDKNVSFYCQPNKIRQLLTIFIDNAIKYNRANGFIELGLKKKENSFDLIIQDNGIGIKKEDQKKIFNRFFRSDQSRSTEGTGLGLSIAQGIIDKHNGSIKIFSKLDKGTKFIINFPYI